MRRIKNLGELSVNLRWNVKSVPSAGNYEVDQGNVVDIRVAIVTELTKGTPKSAYRTGFQNPYNNRTTLI